MYLFPDCIIFIDSPTGKTKVKRGNYVSFGGPGNISVAQFVFGIFLKGKMSQSFILKRRKTNVVYSINGCSRKPEV